MTFATPTAPGRTWSRSHEVALRCHGKNSMMTGLPDENHSPFPNVLAVASSPAVT